jgi:N-methylhydantoinase B
MSAHVSDVAAGQGTRIDDNLAKGPDGALLCTHCGTTVGRPGETFLSEAVRVTGRPGAAGPQVREHAERFVDRAVGFRQLCCPGCYTALLTEVVPEDEDSFRTKEL